MVEITNDICINIWKFKGSVVRVPAANNHFAEQNVKRQKIPTHFAQ